MHSRKRILREVKRHLFHVIMSDLKAFVHRQTKRSNQLILCFTEWCLKCGNSSHKNDNVLIIFSPPGNPWCISLSFFSWREMSFRVKHDRSFHHLMQVNGTHWRAFSTDWIKESPSWQTKVLSSETISQFHKTINNDRLLKYKCWHWSSLCDMLWRSCVTKARSCCFCVRLLFTITLVSN